MNYTSRFPTHVSVAHLAKIECSLKTLARVEGACVIRAATSCMFRPCIIWMKPAQACARLQVQEGHCDCHILYVRSCSDLTTRQTTSSGITKASWREHQRGISFVPHATLLSLRTAKRGSSSRSQAGRVLNEARGRDTAQDPRWKRSVHVATTPPTRGV